MNSILIKTNIISDVALEDVIGTFKSGNRLWSVVPESTVGEYILRVQADMDSSEIVARFNAIGVKAELLEPDGAADQSATGGKAQEPNVELPPLYKAAKTLRDKILYLLSVMQKGAASELAMEVAEMEGISSEEGVADVTISIEQELHKVCDEGVVEKIKEHRQKVRYVINGEHK